LFAGLVLVPNTKEMKHGKMPIPKDPTGNAQPAEDAALALDARGSPTTKTLLDSLP